MAKTRTTLTKSLHTVTAVSRVALELARRESKLSAASAELLVADALYALGYAYHPHDFAFQNDPTIARCVAAVRAELQREPHPDEGHVEFQAGEFPVFGPR